ncbi:hypothetical protein [Rodentibacter trehalosifermentans]|uniref:hypothetical protein n=1 Tax=Rodentibacter trehalosifermentans TaxID=1908263 RepID=UPI000984C5A6|nr:hypothetical protein [Rodentibacter trehalosifermentans]OOF52558.1 hypothetical protein BKK53_04755 [Rodentibacter trehalosifermentans]
MLVKNIEPRLIRVGGEFIAPNQTVDVADDAVGLSGLLDRGALVQIESETTKEQKNAKTKKQES